MAVSAETYERLALEDRDTKWELWDGCLRKKEGMTWEHNEYGFELARAISNSADRTVRVRHNSASLRTLAGNYFVPDVVVVTLAQGAGLRKTPRLETYDDPVSFVAEVRSPSTGNFDRTEKVRAYQERGDLEIWLVHPREHWVVAYRRQADGTYQEERLEGGTVRLVFVPGAEVDLDDLFVEA